MKILGKHHLLTRPRKLVYISLMKKWNQLYQKWKEYIRVDVIMYLVMILLFLLIILFYL